MENARVWYKEAKLVCVWDSGQRFLIWSYFPYSTVYCSTIDGTGFSGKAWRKLSFLNLDAVQEMVRVRLCGFWTFGNFL